MLPALFALAWIAIGRPAHAWEPPTYHGWEQARQNAAESRFQECLKSLKQLPNSTVPLAERTAQGLIVATTGTNRIPVLLVDFSDEAGTWADGDFENLLFAADTNSMAAYYHEVSYGQFTVDGLAYPDNGWYRASNASPYYANGYGGVSDTYPTNAQGLVEEVVRAADADVDFSQYDSNSDGFVDTVIVVFSGYKASATGNPTNDFWPHQWSLSGGNGPGPVSVDGVQVNSYVLVNELFSQFGQFNGALEKIGTFSHEYGHALGLPDLYSTDFDGNYDAHWGLGPFALMAYAHVYSPARPPHMCAWSKIELGWATPTDVTGPMTNVVIRKAESPNPGIFRLWTVGQPTTEYFLVEYRTKTGFDRNLPGCGLLIYHVDEAVKTGDFDADGTINLFDGDLQWDETHKFIDIEAANQTTNDHVLNADVLDDKNGCPQCQTDAGGRGVFFSHENGRTNFNSHSRPSSISYLAQTTSVAVVNIGSCGADSTTADLDVGTVPTPNVDLWVNDCAADTGAEPSTPPCSAYWTSTDIYIDNDYDGTLDEPVYGQRNRLFARVHNLGTTPALNVVVNFYYANNSTGLQFPGHATLIDRATLPLIAGGERALASVWWTIPPPPPNGHYCIGVTATNAEDLQTSQVLNQDNNLGAVNIGHLFARAGDGAPDRPDSGLTSDPIEADFEIENSTEEEVPVQLYAEFSLPEGWAIQFQDLAFGLMWSDPVGPVLAPPLLPGEFRPVRMTLMPPAVVFHGQTGFVRVVQYDATRFPDPSGVMGGIDFPFTVDGHQPDAVLDLATSWVGPAPPTDEEVPVPGATPAMRLDFGPIATDLFGGPDLISYYNVYRGAVPNFVPGPATFHERILTDASPARPGWQYYDRDVGAGPYYYAVTAVDAAGHESALLPRLFISRAGLEVTISWSPATPVFVLQETKSLAPPLWSNALSGAANPVTLLMTGSATFFRLGK